MRGYQPGEQPLRGDVIKLNTNENPYPPSPRVLKLLRSLDGSQLRLYPDPLGGRLCEAVARRHGCGSDEVVLGNGADDILAMCLRAFVERDGSVGYFEPSYSLYPVLAEIAEVEVRPVELGADFEWAMPEGYTASIFFMTNPNAPTGILFPREQVREFCETFSGIVVIDQAYVEFAREDCVDLALELDNVIAVRTFSKAFSLAGIRLGYAVGPSELMRALIKVKDSYNVGRITQELGCAALEDVRYMEGNVERIRQTRARLGGELQRRGFRVWPSETNFLWVRPPEPGARRLYELLRDDGIYVRYFDARRTEDYLRISVGDDADMYALLGSLDRIMAGAGR